MKQTAMKIMFGALYVAAVLIVVSVFNLLDGFLKAFAGFVLFYCGLIVLAQLVSILVGLSHWCVAASRDRQEENLSVPSGVFETEIEAN